MARSSGGVRVEGLSSTIRALKAIGLDATDLKGAFSKIAAEGAVKVNSHAPKRSGRLAGSARGNRAQSKAVITAGRSSVPYAGPVNYGWPKRGIAPSGFMQKADQDMQPVALTRLEQELEAVIKRRGLS